MSKQGCAHLTRDAHFIKHAHLPRSIWAARVVWGRWEVGNFRVMVDVEQCPGCCDGPCGMMTTLNDWGGLCMPGLMNTVHRPYALELDGYLAEVDRCSGQRTELGDYGNCSDGALTRTGNIFEDMRIIGIDPEDSAYHPVVSHVSGDTWLKLHMRIQADVAIVYHTTSRRRLALHRAKGISLPTNERFVLLLKACSTRLAGKHLVTTLIQCSDFYRLDEDGNRRDSGHDFTPESDLYAPETGIFSPFCAIASPQVWRREPPCVRRREQFRSIREHFYALYRPTGTQWSHRFSNKRKEARAVRFFLGLFGLTYLRSYVCINPLDASSYSILPLNVGWRDNFLRKTTLGGGIRST
ncbi:hypothetical protein EV401DRAFT_2024416 [Pisolithus croceorrhizus]|nr:hypothetical protein EV401DRAFT_2024416 [Pisolithus croceorrhizus]